MKTYDWIVIGGGFTGSGLAYELVKKGFKVLLVEKDAPPDNATVYSYGGLAYWSGTTELTRQLCIEGIAIQRHLSEELEADTEFRELNLLLTIDVQDDPIAIANDYARFAIAPRLLNPQEATELEPLLNPQAIAGVLQFPHGHIHPQKTTLGYQKAFCRAGGEITIECVIELHRQGDRILGVKTANQTYHSANTVVCAGALSRSLLKETGISLPHYFTHAQLIKTPPVDIQLQAIVMPAVQKRFILESIVETLWDKPSEQTVSSILDSGAVQFCDRSLCIGQISQIVTNPEAKMDLVTGEKEIRTEIARILPLLENLPGTSHQCLVAFTNNSIALVNAVNNLEGIYIFSGFTSTLVFAPPLARHFANWVAGEEDEIITQLSRLK
jgi:glycine/D-amino acid oxidase-like deaminating enzyme